MRTTTLLLCASALLGACAADLTSGSGGGADLTQDIAYDGGKPVHCLGLPSSLLVNDATERELFYLISMDERGNEATIRVGGMSRFALGENPFYSKTYRASNEQGHFSAVLETNIKSTGQAEQRTIEFDYQSSTAQDKRKPGRITRLRHRLDDKTNVELRSGATLTCYRRNPNRDTLLSHPEYIIALATHLSRRAQLRVFGDFVEDEHRQASGSSVHLTNSPGELAYCEASYDSPVQCTYRMNVNWLELSDATLGEAAAQLGLADKNAIQETTELTLQFEVPRRQTGASTDVALYVSRWRDHLDASGDATQKLRSDRPVFRLDFATDSWVNVKFHLTGADILSREEAAELLWQPQGS